MMIDSYKLKVSWSLIRAHLCTAAVAVGFQAIWRSPRDAFRFGGLQYALVFTVAMIGVALPLVLLQLAIGQLSQQDPVGVWRAVPFFKGVGYMRLLISFLAAIYTIIYTSLSITYFLYTLTNSLPFWECIDTAFNEEAYENYVNASTCLNDTFMAPVSEKIEYYMAVALIVLVLWILFPFIFYNPVKLMKRLMYVLGPTVIILIVVTASCIGNSINLSDFIKKSDWKSFIEPNIWYGALTQALLSSQVAGGYLISAGDTVYSNTNVKWSAIAFVVANIVSTWVALLFWYSINGEDKNTTVFAVLLQVYNVGEDPSIEAAWSLIILFILIISGFITLLTFLYPIYDRYRRIGGVRWRVLSAAGSLAGAVISSAVLAMRESALSVLDDFSVPLLICLATILEICALIFIYGWKVLVEDIEFLTGHKLGKCWVLGWCSAPGIIAPFTIWWITVVYLSNDDWLQPPWPQITIISTTVLAVVVFLILASVVVAKQVQYDIIGKLKSSFKSSRHWGPRDPITHYYWLARREEIERGNVGRTRYHRRRLGQLSGRPSFLIRSESISRNYENLEVTKTRSNSDDWLYTVYRKQILNINEIDSERRKRAKSLDWAYIKTSDPVILNKITQLSFTSYQAFPEKNNNIVEKNNNRNSNN